MAIKQYTWQELNEMRISKGELFSELAKDKTVEFDYALPQEWLDKFADWCVVNYPIITYHLIRSTTVWLYSGDSYFGKPLSCCKEVDTALNHYLKGQ